MYSVKLKWPEKRIDLVINPGESWNLSDVVDFEDSGEAFFAKVSPQIDTVSGVFGKFLVSDISAIDNVITLKFFDVQIDRATLYENLTINLREMRPTDFFPQNLSVLNYPNAICEFNLFFMENGTYKYKFTKSDALKKIKSTIESVLKTAKFSCVDYEVTYFVNENENIVVTDANFSNIIANGQKVMNIGIKTNNIIVIHLGKRRGLKKIEIDYLPIVPKKLLIWSLNNLTIGDENQQSLKRRLVRMLTGSCIPVDLLPKIDGLGLGVHQFQRLSLPFSSWNEHSTSVLENPLAQDALKCARLNLNHQVSEATLRFRVWDTLIKSFAPDIDRIESELYAKNVLGLASDIKLDLAMVTKQFNLPVFVSEIGKEQPADGHEHKNFVKLGTVLSQSCLKLAEALKSRGHDPLEARTFGTLVGYTTFKFFVASPEIVLNEIYNREEIFVNLTFFGHWCMDLITASATTNCSSICCSQPPGTIIMPTTVAAIEEAIINDRENIVLINEEENQVEQVNQVTQQEQLQQGGLGYNMEAVCKLKIFIECANKAAARFEELLNHPILQPDVNNLNTTIFPSAGPLIVKSLAKSSDRTPNPKRIRHLDTATIKGNGNSVGFRAIIIEKPASREIDVYKSIPKHYKILFPILHDFQVDPEDPKMHIFTLEELQPLLENEGIIRVGNMRILLLEAATFCVHILFSLLILHEKIGYVHADLSPNNIMFSRRLNIWKLADFDLSLPIEESMKSPRLAGTENFQAPESERSGIWTQASDVFALGTVVENCFFDRMKKYHLGENDILPFEIFSDLLDGMCASDPAQRVSVRDALKHFIDFVYKFEIRSLRIYGYHLIFPLALEELKTIPPISPATTEVK